MPLTDVHFTILNALYLCDDPMGIAQLPLKVKGVTVDPGLEEIVGNVPCRNEIHSLVTAGYIREVMDPASPEERVKPHRFVMTDGKDGLRDNYAVLCSHYKKQMPVATRPGNPNPDPAPTKQPPRPQTSQPKTPDLQNA